MKRNILIVVMVIVATIIASGTISTDLKKSGSLNDRHFAVTADQQKADTTMKTVYVCSMHKEVVMDKPGKCPKCGMDLTAKQIKIENYTCPMHPKVSQGKPGKCPKCGMNLVLKEPVKKADTSKK